MAQRNLGDQALGRAQKSGNSSELKVTRKGIWEVLPISYGEGVFAGYDGTYNIIQIPTAFGNSGSGVFDKNSNLVSMVFAVHGVNMFYHDLTHGLCIDSSVIESFLKDHNINF